MLRSHPRRTFSLLLAALALCAALVMATVASSATVVGTNVLYTTDADFDQGTLVNVNHDAPNNNQLQLNQASGTFPFIWVALSVRCTIGKVNTQTGEILGEYRTVSDSASCNQSSRTTVGLDGSVWVGHRGPGGVTHVGLEELNECVDRNGNGTIETSTGYGDVKPWTGGDSNVANAQDECILHHVNTDAVLGGFADSRHMSIDANNKLWVGSFNSGGMFVRINGATGAIETAPRDMPCGGYGGLIDGNGVIWSAQGGGFGLLRWNPDAPDSATNPRCIGVQTYGLAVDGNDGSIWATTLGSQVWKVSSDGNTIQGPFNHGAGNAQGLAVSSNGDVWVSSSLFCGAGCTIGHLKSNGTFVGNVPNPTGAGSTGIAVDAAGKIWSANLNSNTATRIDPTGGPIGADGSTRVGAVDLTVNFPAGPDGRPSPQPYNYSDMTGAQLLSSTAPQGTWTVTQDGGAAGTDWGRITWNTEPQGNVPAGASITVEARAADSEAALGSEAYVPVSNGADFTLNGRFIQVRATLRPNASGASPVLSDIRIAADDGGPPPVRGWMSGEGRLTQSGNHLDYAYIVDCDPAKTPNFKGKRGSQNLTVTDITSVSCTDDPNEEPAKAGATFDTMEGAGTGKLGATNVIVEFKFVDGGLDNTDDSAQITIKRASDGAVLFTASAEPVPPYGGGTRLGRNTANPPPCPC